MAAERLLNALLERLVRRDCGFGISDRFEAGFHFEVERERSVVRGVRGIGFEVETAASGFLGTGALDDRPGLSEFAGELENAVDLVAAGEGAAVEKDFASRSILQQEAGGFEHDLHHEVVLLDGVFDIFWREQGGADLVFAEERALSAAGQFASERGFAGSGKACHQNNHSVESVEAESGKSVGGAHAAVGQSSDIARCGARFFRRRMRENRLRLTPVIVAVGDHHVKAPVVALFFGLDQAERVQIEQVAFDKADLLFRHAAALQVDRDAGEMRRRGVTFRRSGVAIVAAKFLLPLDGAHRGIDLDLSVELPVVDFGKVLDKIAGPGTAIAARGIKTGFNLQRLARPRSAPARPRP